MTKVSNKNPLISVIVPVYNTEKYLSECIDSIINQTYKNLEIILIDDGSPDDCGSICDNYAKKDKRIKVYHNKNNGVSYTRNFGISKATGDYIGFIDSDDFISEKMYEILLKNIIDNNADVSICDISRKVGNIQTDKLEKIILYNQDQYLKKFFRINSQTCEYYPVNKLYKKDVIVDDMFPRKYKEGEDAFAILKVIFKSKTIVYTPINLYYYRKNENSVTSRFSETDLELIDLWDDIIKYTKQVNSEYLDYAVLNRKRLNFTLLTRMTLSIKPKLLKEDVRVKKMLLELKKDEKVLLSSSITLSRKIIIYLFCRSFYFSSNIIYLVNKIRR